MKICSVAGSISNREPNDDPTLSEGDKCNLVKWAQTSKKTPYMFFR